MAALGTIADAGEHDGHRSLEFFAASSHNQSIDDAYMIGQPVHCLERAAPDRPTADIEQPDVAAYIEMLSRDFEKPMVKPDLAAIRMLFHWLFTGNVLVTSQAHGVRELKHKVKRGKHRC